MTQQLKEELATFLTVVANGKAKHAPGARELLQKLDPARYAKLKTK